MSTTWHCIVTCTLKHAHFGFKGKPMHVFGSSYEPTFCVPICCVWWKCWEQFKIRCMNQNETGSMLVEKAYLWASSVGWPTSQDLAVRREWDIHLELVRDVVKTGLLGTSPSQHTTLFFFFTPLKTPSLLLFAVQMLFWEAINHIRKNHIQYFATG